MVRASRRIEIYVSEKDEQLWDEAKAIWPDKSQSRILWEALAHYIRVARAANQQSPQ